jgi:hypothetical protein
VAVDVPAVHAQHRDRVGGPAVSAVRLPGGLVTAPAAPTLTEVAERPDLALQLTRETGRALYFQALAVLTALGPVICAEPAVPMDDRVLATAEAAEILGVSESLLAHGARTTYKSLVVRQGRRLGFSARRVQDFIRRRAGQ